MTALDQNPSTQSMLSPVNFAMTIKRCPNVDWFIQKINLPGIALTPTEYATPMMGLPEVGDHMKWEDLRIRYKVSEDLSSWFEIFNWILAIAAHESPTEYYGIEHQSMFSGLGIKSDITVIVVDSNKNPSYNITYRDAYPVGLSQLDFDTTVNDINYLSTTAVFKYTDYIITKS